MSQIKTLCSSSLRFMHLKTHSWCDERSCTAVSVCVLESPQFNTRVCEINTLDRAPQISFFVVLIFLKSIRTSFMSQMCKTGPVQRLCTSLNSCNDPVLPSVISLLPFCLIAIEASVIMCGQRKWSVWGFTPWSPAYGRVPFTVKLELSDS